jgi:hypothetical protein
MFSKRSIILLSLLIFLLACGPYFAPRILPGNRIYTSIPLASFSGELVAMDPKFSLPQNFKQVDDRTDFEKELVEALNYYGVKNVEAVTRFYMKIRKRIEDFRLVKKEDASATFPKLLIPDGLPKEFDLYLDGAINFYEGNTVMALKRWRALLALPPKERLYRTVWARYMCAQVLQKSDSEAVATEYELLRQDVKAGFKDAQGLAIESYGQEGRFYLDQKLHLQALESYYKQERSGGKGAQLSLEFTLRSLFKNSPNELVLASKSPFARQIITAYFISSFSSSGQLIRTQWLELLEKEDVKELEMIERLAWLAYQEGDLTVAKRYLALCREGSVIRHWLLSRFALRDGKTSEAYEQLVLLTEVLKSNERYARTSVQEEWFEDYVGGEAALLKLEMGQFKQALKLFLASPYWEDAAYLAERILTPDELILFIEENKTFLQTVPESQGRLKFLLARKLARDECWIDALKYYPEKMATKAKEYLSERNRSIDKQLSQEERAESLWKCAVLFREYGMDLMGTELFPDAQFYGGRHEAVAMDDLRIELAEKNELKISAEERKRVAVPSATPNERFHYRYKAADLAWDAIALIKADRDATAEKLIIAGSWLKDRNPKAADRFYKELVRKCPNTKLGKEAEKLRWFPKLPDVKVDEK